MSNWFGVVKLNPTDRRRRMYADLEVELEDKVINAIDKLMNEREFDSVAEIGSEPMPLPGINLLVDAEDEDYLQLYVSDYGEGNEAVPIGTVDWEERKIELQEDLLNKVSVRTLRQIVPTEKQRMARDMKRFQTSPRYKKDDVDRQISWERYLDRKRKEE
tara:strand:- start:5108 stop:5587 length:480 start_codon:yes stop_codon:yes gene_type:complete